ECDFLINCAAFTQVDACESHPKEAEALNAIGPGYLAEFCRNHNIKMIHFSTEYVFDGTKNTPYEENDRPNPINVYGHSKLAGENTLLSTLKEAYILRIQWLYGKKRNNFVSFIEQSGSHPITCITDQMGSPSSTTDLANIVEPFLHLNPPFGVYHLGNSGYVSWYDFSLEICAQLGKNTAHITPVTSDKLNRLAKRPLNSTLNISKFIHHTKITPPHWKEALRNYIVNSS
ncbi:MAG: dTDP-4-dehydrorhamnose reductase, partial [Candidatus Margulisbacteria bacterium]|nr:dTDP-4-dehydrorhamnose reductase [Candidatus Margulisiibacteriota bacterium]